MYNHHLARESLSYFISIFSLPLFVPLSFSHSLTMCAPWHELGCFQINPVNRNFQPVVHRVYQTNICFKIYLNCLLKNINNNNNSTSTPKPYPWHIHYHVKHTVHSVTYAIVTINRYDVSIYQLLICLKDCFFFNFFLFEFVFEFDTRVAGGLQIVMTIININPSDLFCSGHCARGIDTHYLYAYVVYVLFSHRQFDWKVLDW